MAGESPILIHKDAPFTLKKDAWYSSVTSSTRCNTYICNSLLSLRLLFWEGFKPNSCRAATSTVFHLQHPQTGRVWLCPSLLDLDKQCFSWAFFYRGLGKLSGCLGLSSLNWSELIALKHPRIRTVWSCPITFVPAHQEDMLVQSHWRGKFHMICDVFSFRWRSRMEWNGHWNDHILLKLCLCVIWEGWRGFREMLMVISVELWGDAVAQNLKQTYQGYWDMQKALQYLILNEICRKHSHICTVFVEAVL